MSARDDLRESIDDYLDRYADYESFCLLDELALVLDGEELTPIMNWFDVNRG